MRNKKLLVRIEVAICAALAFVLGFVTIFQMPQGGAISLGMLPLFVLAYRRGVKAALLGGFIHAILGIIFRLFFMHVFQVFLDYILVDMVLAVAGLFAVPVKNSLANGEKMRARLYMIVGIFLGSVLKFFAHFVSGVIFFGQFAPEGVSPVMHSLIYNSTHMGLPFLLVATVAGILLPLAPGLLDVSTRGVHLQVEG